jgi:hypothetical protein
MTITTGEKKMKHNRRISFVVGFMLIGLLFAGAAAAESSIPSPRGYVSLAYDSESQQVVLYGGHTGVWGLRTSINGETWTYDVNTNIWTQMFPKPEPRDRSAAQLGYDAESDRVIMYGGGLHRIGNSRIDETWAYDHNTVTWKRMADGPKNHLGGRLAYDAESDRMILFGGIDVKGWFLYDDTWAYDYNSDIWTEMTPAASPPGRNYQAMTYDSQADRVLTWGGVYMDESPLPESMWAYDYNTNTWEEFPTGEGPYPKSRDYAAMAYDVGSDRTILFGGLPIEDPDGEVGTWAYDYNTHTWEKMNPPVEPPSVSRHAMVYSVATDRVILFGGEDDDGVMFTYPNETWAYDYNTNTWTNLTP